MLMTALLLVVIWALLTGILAVLHICNDPLPPAGATPSVPAVLDPSKAVMTLWYETRFHLDKLERAGADVTTARRHLTQTVETLLSAPLPHQAPDLNEPSSQALAEHDAPAVVECFGSLRIFG